MKNFMLILLVIGATFVHSKVFAISPPIPNTCNENFNPGGGGKSGHEAWPWSIAKPFPWASIQGVWSAQDSQTNLFFSFRVTRTTDQIKQLAVEIYDANTCKKTTGIGVISNTEKNTVRVNLNDVLLKMALFNTSDLKLNANSCGFKAIGATFYKLTDNDESSSGFMSDIGFVADSRNMLLRKMSNSPIVYKCKN